MEGDPGAGEGDPAGSMASAAPRSRPAGHMLVLQKGNPEHGLVASENGQKILAHLQDPPPMRVFVQGHSVI